jgi:hypothetical protein
MARYNTAFKTLVVTGTATISTPLQGTVLVTLTSTTGYTVTLPNPVLFPGATFSIYNNTNGSCTLSTPAGAFTVGAAGASTQAIASGLLFTLISDGTNWITWADAGGPISATTLTASSTVTLSPASANVTISPTGSGNVTIAPASAGAINNMTIGQSTAAAGTFTSLTSTGTATLQLISEVLNTKSGASGTVVHDMSTGDIWYHTGIAANFTSNFTNVPTTSNRTAVATLILVQGGTPFNSTGLQINGVGYTINWAGGVVPGGRASKIDIVTFFIYNVGGTFAVTGQMSSFG